MALALSNVSNAFGREAARHDRRKKATAELPMELAEVPMNFLLPGPNAPEEFLAGAFSGQGDSDNDPALKFLHGTTTLGFVFSGGIIIAVDSRASMGSYVGKQTVSRDGAKVDQL
eukprot:2184281-Rhodomonas_salina.2